jgi:hypothetical protein
MSKRIVFTAFIVIFAASAFSLDFDPSIWNMNGVGRGYPTLAGMGGQ